MPHFYGHWRRLVLAFSQMNDEALEKVVRAGMYFVPFLFSLCVHEFAHGWVALKRGDQTAKMMGRLTLNPMAHADPVGTFILPIMSLLFGSPIFFGWAKPVPVNTRNLKNPRADMFWVALAGPLSNIIMAFVGAFVLVFAETQLMSFGESVQTLMFIFIQLNLFLAVFNLIPVHPLDGGKIIARFLPYSLERKMEEHQQAISLVLMIMFLTGMMSILRYPVVILMGAFINLARMIL